MNLFYRCQSLTRDDDTILQFTFTCASKRSVIFLANILDIIYLLCELSSVYNSDIFQFLILTMTRRNIDLFILTQFINTTQNFAFDNEALVDMQVRLFLFYTKYASSVSLCYCHAMVFLVALE